MVFEGSFAVLTLPLNYVYLQVILKNYGPLLVTDKITAPSIQGYQDGTLMLGTGLAGLRFMALALGVLQASQ